MKLTATALVVCSVCQGVLPVCCDFCGNDFVAGTKIVCDQSVGRHACVDCMGGKKK